MNIPQYTNLPFSIRIYHIGSVLFIVSLIVLLPIHHINILKIIYLTFYGFENCLGNSCGLFGGKYFFIG